MASASASFSTLAAFNARSAGSTVFQSIIPLPAHTVPISAQEITQLNLINSRRKLHLAWLTVIPVYRNREKLTKKVNLTGQTRQRQHLPSKPAAVEIE